MISFGLESITFGANWVESVSKLNDIREWKSMPFFTQGKLYDYHAAQGNDVVMCGLSRPILEVPHHQHGREDAGIC